MDKQINQSCVEIINSKLYPCPDCASLISKRGSGVSEVRSSVGSRREQYSSFKNVFGRYIQGADDRHLPSKLDELFLAYSVGNHFDSGDFWNNHIAVDHN